MARPESSPRDYKWTDCMVQHFHSWKWKQGRAEMCARRPREASSNIVQCGDMGGPRDVPTDVSQPRSGI